jgi:hypothetical protein
MISQQTIEELKEVKRMGAKMNRGRVNQYKIPEKYAFNYDKMSKTSKDELLSYAVDVVREIKRRTEEAKSLRAIFGEYYLAHRFQKESICFQRGFKRRFHEWAINYPEEIKATIRAYHDLCNYIEVLTCCLVGSVGSIGKERKRDTERCLFELFLDKGIDLLSHCWEDDFNREYTTSERMVSLLETIKDYNTSKSGFSSGFSPC